MIFVIKIFHGGGVHVKIGHKRKGVPHISFIWWCRGRGEGWSRLTPYLVSTLIICLSHIFNCRSECIIFRYLISYCNLISCMLHVSSMYRKLLIIVHSEFVNCKLLFVSFISLSIFQNTILFCENGMVHLF